MDAAVELKEVLDAISAQAMDAPALAGARGELFAVVVVAAHRGNNGGDPRITVLSTGEGDGSALMDPLGRAGLTVARQCGLDIKATDGVLALSGVGPEPH